VRYREEGRQRSGHARLADGAGADDVDAAGREAVCHLPPRRPV